MAPYDASAGWSREEPSALARPVEPISFKDALARLASGVAIVSCWDGETPRGLLVSSITGLSVEPPRFLFCVRKQAASHDALIAAKACGVAILAADDAAEASCFATSDRFTERFTDPRWTLQADAPPLYAGGLSSARCEVVQVIDAETHSVVIVEAKDLKLGAGRPLVAYDRNFHAIHPT